MFNQVQCIEDCGNGYGWSIIDLGHCFELAVLKDSYICYSTDITSDVVRGDWDDMMALTERIRSL
jgi:hypothetical protein